MTVNARARYCGVNDGLWIQRATPPFFQQPATPPGSPRFGAPRPERPRDPASPGADEPVARDSSPSLHGREHPRRRPRSRRRPAGGRNATGFRRQAPAGRRSDLGSLGIACSRRAQLTGGQEHPGRQTDARDVVCARCGQPQMTGGGGGYTRSGGRSGLGLAPRSRSAGRAVTAVGGEKTRIRPQCTLLFNLAMEVGRQGPAAGGGDRRRARHSVSHLVYGSAGRTVTTVGGEEMRIGK